MTIEYGYLNSKEPSVRLWASWKQQTTDNAKSRDSYWSILEKFKEMWKHLCVKNGKIGVFSWAIALGVVPVLRQFNLGKQKQSLSFTLEVMCIICLGSSHCPVRIWFYLNCRIFLTGAPVSLVNVNKPTTDIRPSRPFYAQNRLLCEYPAVQLCLKKKFS